MIIALQALYLFQKSLLVVFEQLEPYLKNIFFYKNSTDVNSEEDSDDDVYSEYDDNKGVVFYPPVYTQRYAAVSDCLIDTRWRGQLEKVIDFGCNDMSFIKCLKDICGIREIMGVDLDPIPITLDLKSDRYSQKRENPLKITLYQGNAADPDYRLIGCDAVVSIEMIEHMLPHDLERFVHNIFGFIKPRVVVITTPNGDFNVLFKALETNGLRRLDHMFEWSQEQFHDWCSNIVTRYPEYSVSCKGIGPGPPGTSHLGCCSQLALFVASNYEKQTELSPNSLAIVECESGSAMTDSMDSWDMTESVLENRLHCTNNQVKRFSKTTHQLMAKNKLDSLVNAKDVVSEIRHLSKIANPDSQELIWKNINWGEDAPYWNKYYKIIKEYSYPFASDETRILEIIAEEINRLICSSGDESFSQDDKMDIPIGYIMGVISHITDDEDKVRELLEWNGYEVVGDTVVYTKLIEDDLQADVQREWIEVDSVSDWVSTDSQSLDMLENIMEPDMFEYDLQISLDRKIHSLLKLSKRKDVSSELERLVSQLVDLVQDSRRTELPPHPTWLLHKLYGLFAVTEKAVMKQRRNFIGDCKKAIKFSKKFKGDQNMTIPVGVKKACKAENILDRYESILLGSDNDQRIEDLKYENSNEYLIHFKMTNGNMSSDDTDRENKAFLQNYDSLIDELELREVNYKEVKKADTTTCASTGNIHVLQKKGKMAETSSTATKYLQTNNNDDEGIIIIKAEPMRKRQRKFIGHKNKLKPKKHKKTRKFTSLAPGYINYFKHETIQYHQQKVRLHNKINYYNPMCKSIKPIPSSLMNLFNSSQNKIELSQKSSIDVTEFSEPESLVTVKYQEDATINRTVETEPNILEKSEKKDVESKVDKSVSCQKETNIQEGFGNKSVLFLYDINEPSTSNGIRHISADIQCGPDDLMDVSQTQLANYTLNITSKRLNTDLNIQASISDFQNTIGTNTSNNALDNYDSIITKEHVVEDLKVEESKKYEIQEDTKSLTKSVFEKQIGKIFDTTVKPHETKVNSKRSYLSYGGIYVHCYKDSNSKDIVYQGKWQECNSKTIAKKTPIVLYGRRKEMIVKKKIVITEKDLFNKSGPAVNNREYKRKISYRNSVPINVSHRKPEKHSCLDHGNAKKKNRHVRLVKPSVDIRPLETSTTVTKFFNTSHIFDIKNYIPAYLKRRIHKHSMDKKLNLNLNIVLNTYNEGKQLDKLQLKSAGKTQTARHKPNSYIRKIPAYQVYRNEIDKEIIDPRGAEDEKLKKCIPASTSSYDPSSSRSNNVTYRNITNYGVGYSSERSSSDNYEPGNYSKIRRFRKLKSNNNVKTFMTKIENIDNTTESPRSLETVKSPGLSGVDLTDTSLDLSFSNYRLLKCKEVTNSASNTHSAHNTQTYESAYKLAFVEAEKSNENVDTDTDDNIEKQIRYLINESLTTFVRFCTVDKKGGVHNLDQIADDKESVRSDYTSTLTLPSTSSAAKTELFTGIQEENGSKVSIEYSNRDSGVQDVELLSPMSVASVTTSKFSEYLSADNEFEDSSSLNSNSVFSLPQNSFDLKENMSNIDNTVMPVGIFKESNDDNRVDLNNIVDSEIRTEQERARHVLPEISQRSSDDAYMSCSTDDDTQIPYWLFESDSEPERLVTSLPLEEETENSEDETEDETEDDPPEMAVVGIGAGDGRGIHSDLSRDTSGRGTSLNSGTSSLESQETLSNPSNQLSEYNVEPQDLPNNNAPAIEPVETNDTPNLPSRSLTNDTDGDASSLDYEY